jgi:hypothetical protein
MEQRIAGRQRSLSKVDGVIDTAIAASWTLHDLYDYGGLARVIVDLRISMTATVA